MSQLGRISGPLLKSNLIRNGVNLAFETNLLYLDVNNKRIGINVVDPLDTINELTHDLTVNGVTRTSTIDITGGSVDIGNITISGDTIQSNTGVLNLIGAANGSVIYQSKLLVDDFKIENNIISTTTSNANIELRPHGTGTVEIFGNTNVTGNITATGNISAGGNIQIGSTDQTIPNNDTVTFNAEISSDVIPDVTDTHSLGSSDNRWKDLWVKNLDADSLTSGSLVVDGIDLALTQGKIYYVADNGSDTNVGQHQNDPFATIKKALTEATREDTVYIYPGTYIEQFPLIVPVGVTVKGSGIRSVKIVPTAATRYNDAFLLNGEATIEDLTVADFFSGGNFFNVTAASFESTTINVGTAPFAHTYVSDGTINIDGTDYPITNAVYTHTTGVVVLSHTGGTATPSTTVFLSNLTFSCNGGNRTFPDNGYAFRFATDFTVTSRSPYVRNITVLTKGSVTSVSDPLGYAVGDAGKGAYIDGAYATALSKEASMLFHSATFICPGVDIIVATNGARVEWLNSFTYYANRGMYLYSSNDGFAGAGLTRLKLPVATRTGTWAVGNIVSYYDTDGTTVLASGTVDSIDGDWINLTGRAQGFLIPADRDPKTVTLNGDAKLSTAQQKFGTASLVLDGTGDFITLNSQVDFGYGTGDFTIEFFWRPTALGTAQVLLDCRTAANDTALYLEMNAAGSVRLFVSNAYRITSSVACTAGTFNHIVLFRTGGVTKLAVNGTITPTTFADATDYPARPFRLGASWVGNALCTGYFDELRVVKGVTKYTTAVTVPTAPFLADTSTVLLLHFNGLNNSTNVVDDGVTFVDIRSSALGATTDLAVADYSDFGAEMRAIGSASVYGQYGIYGDGVGVIAYLIGQNLAYIGNGGTTTNDPTTVNQANEIVELNGAKLYYQSVDHKGDFRIGDLFYVNQQTGEVTFSNSNINVGTSLTFDDGLGNVTFLDASKIETGDFRISGNTIQTLTQDFNISSASNLINLESDVHITGSLDVVGNVTIGGNITIGDQTTDTVSFVAGVNSDILPMTTDTYNLGSPSLQWKGIYSTEANIGSIRIDSNVITTTDSNANLELRANGSGKILVPSNNVQLDQDLTVNGTTNTKDINVTGTITQTGDVVQTGSLTQTGDVNVTGTITVSGDAQFNDVLVSGNVVTTTVGNNDLTLSANGTGQILVPTADVTITNDLTVNGLASIDTFTTNNTLTAGAFSTGDILISQNNITTTQSNSNLVIEANGNGQITVPTNDVYLSQQLTVVGTTNTDDINITGTLTQTGSVTHTGNTNQTGDITLTGNLTVSNTAQFKDVNIDNNVITTTIGNNDLLLQAAGTGKVLVPSNNVEITNNLTVDGTTSTTTLNNTGTVTSTTFTTGDISVTGNTISTTVSNSNLELLAAGSGKIYVPSNDVQFGQALNVVGTTTLDDTNITGTLTHVGATTQTGDTNQTGNFVLTGNLTVGATAQFTDIKIDNNVITTTTSNADLDLRANGSGQVLIPSNNVRVNQTLTVVGATSTTTINNTGTVTSDTFTTGDITISNNLITTSVSNSNLELQASGTGKIYVPNNDVQMDRALTVIGLSTLGNLTVVGTITHTGNTTQTGDVTQTGSYILNGNLTVGATAQFKDVNIDNNVITTTIDNNDLNLQAAGTGRIFVPSNNVVIEQNLTVTGTTSTTTINNSGTVTAATFTNGNITVNGNTIQTTVTNSNLQLQAAGTGFIELEQFEVQDNTIRISASNTDLVLQPNGTGIVSIDSTQALKLPAGDNSQRPTAVAGMIRFNTELSRYEGYNGTTWVRLDGVEDADGNTKITAELTPGANDNTIRFYTNGTQVADLNSTRFNVNNIDVDAINISGNTLSTITADTNLIISPNGTGSVRTGNFSFKDNVITNTVNNSITVFNSTGDGYVKINSTGGFVIPSGLTVQRPPLFAVGMMRYNTDPGNFRVEIWNGSSWVDAGQGASGGGVSAAEAEDIGIVSAIIFG